jgi:hypothetical protein
MSSKEEEEKSPPPCGHCRPPSSAPSRWHKGSLLRGRYALSSSSRRKRPLPTASLKSQWNSPLSR